MFIFHIWYNPLKQKIDSEVLGEFNKIKIGGKKGFTTTSPEVGTVEVPAVEPRNQFDFIEVCDLFG